MQLIAPVRIFMVFRVDVSPLLYVDIYTIHQIFHNQIKLRMGSFENE
jgi:hypothetical protein